MTDDQISRFESCFNHQDFSGAFDVCSEAIQPDAADWNAIYLAGVTFRFRGDFAQAVEHYQRALKLNPGEASIWQALGIALQSLRRFPEAIDALQSALRIDGNAYSAHNSLGLTYNLAGDYQSAMRAYEDALQVRANEAMGEVRRDHPELFRMEQRGDARVLVIHPSYAEHMRQILVTDFNYFNTMRNMITCCIEMGDHARARDLQHHVDTCTPISADIIGPVRTAPGN